MGTEEQRAIGGTPFDENPKDQEIRSNKAKLKLHVMIKHENGKGLKMHQCSECPYKTPHSNILKIHVKAVHERKEEDKQFRSEIS